MKRISTLFLILSNLSYAGSMGLVSSPAQYYLKIGSGGSYSLNSNIYADPIYWDASPQGYNDDLGQTALYSAAVGYNPTDLYSVDVEYIYRPNYSYAKYQTSTAANTIKFNGNKTRYFNLQSNSLMANLYFHGSQYARSIWQDFRIQPFIGAGIGVGFNTVSNFHSEKDPAVNEYVVAVEQDRLRSSLAWQLSAGLELLSCNYLNLDAGYRYYNGGTYNSNNYIINTQDYGTPWTGIISANEFFVRLSKTFA